MSHPHGTVIARLGSRAPKALLTRSASREGTMASDATALQLFHDHLVELFGTAHADSLISVFTATDMASLVTKDDLAHEFALVRSEMATMKHELIGAFRAELLTAISAQTRPLLLSLVGVAVLFAGTLLAAVRVG
jgi:hypothetical protein